MSTANLFARSNPSDIFKNGGSTTTQHNPFAGSSNRPGTSTNWMQNGTTAQSNPFAAGIGGNTSMGANSMGMGTTPTYGTNTQSKLGSVRVPNFDSNRNSYSSTNAAANKTWNDKNYPISIASFETTGQLSPLEIRLEDYYMIRMGYLTESNKTSVNTAATKKCFNALLLSASNKPQPPPTATYTYQSNVNRMTGTTYTSGNTTYGTPVGFGQQQQTGNIFGNNGSNNAAAVFRNSTTTFNQNDALRASNTNTNIFAAGQTNNQPINNPFGQNTTGGTINNVFNQQPSAFSNPFGQTQNTSSNPMNPNLFSTNQNTQNSNNLFANNNLYQNNNRGSTTNGNLFANTTTGASNNLFASQANPYNNNGSNYGNQNVFQQNLQHSQVGQYHPQQQYQSLFAQPLNASQFFSGGIGAPRQAIFSSTAYNYPQQSSLTTSAYQPSRYDPPVLSSTSLYGPPQYASRNGWQHTAEDPDRKIAYIVAEVCSQMGMIRPQSRGAGMTGSRVGQSDDELIRKKPLIHERIDEDEELFYRPKQQIVTIREAPKQVEKNTFEPPYYEQESVANLKPGDFRKGMEPNRVRQSIFSSPVPQAREREAGRFTDVLVNVRRDDGGYLTVAVDFSNDRPTRQAIKEKLIEKGQMAEYDELEITNLELRPSGNPIIECLLKKRFSINLPAGYSSSPTASLSPIISRLKIWNQHGSVEWEQPVDISGIDFRNLIIIEDGAVEFYRGRKQAPPGSEINKPCVVTFAKCAAADMVRAKQPQASDFRQRVEKRLRVACQRNNAEFVGFNESTGEWSFRLRTLPTDEEK